MVIQETPRRENRLDFKGVQATSDPPGAHARVAQLPENAAQGLCGLRISLQPPYAGVFLAQVDKLEEEAKGMSNIVSFLNVQPSGQSAERGGRLAPDLGTCRFRELSK